MKYEYGNMLKIDCDALVVTTNGYVKSNGECVMGRGIAKQVAQRIPRLSLVLGSNIKATGNNVYHLGHHNGVAVVTFPVKPVSKIMTAPSDVVTHMQSQFKIGDSVMGWACVADKEIIERSLQQLVELADTQSWQRILVPYFGCGAGELEWSDIKPLAEKYLDDRFIAVTYSASNHQLYINHSGGALGSDTLWGEFGNPHGVVSNHYWYMERTPRGNLEITEQQFKEGLEQSRIVAKQWGIHPASKPFVQHLLSRNWQQVDNADCIYAIAQNFEKAPSGVIRVSGGTGYAVQMAINAGKQIYVYSQHHEKWITWTGKEWMESDTPVLTKDFAGIGTRDINNLGIQAIKDVFAKTFQ